jgi:hypothetical protein
MDFKDVLSDWTKDIIFGLPVEKCPKFLLDYYDLLDDSYIQYYLFYRASKGLFKKTVLSLSSEELIDEVERIHKGT